MDRRRSQLLDCLTMYTRTVAFVSGQFVTREPLVQMLHEPIPGNFRKYGSCSNVQRSAVALCDFAHRAWKTIVLSFEGQPPVEERHPDSRALAQPPECSNDCQSTSARNSQPIDLKRRRERDAGGCLSTDGCKQPIAVARRNAFRVIESSKCFADFRSIVAFRVKRNASYGHWTADRSAAGFVEANESHPRAPG